MMVRGVDDLRGRVAVELVGLLAYEGPLSPSGARATVIAPQNFRRGSVTPARRELFQELRRRYLLAKPMWSGRAGRRCSRLGCP